MLFLLLISFNQKQKLLDIILKFYDQMDMGGIQTLKSLILQGK